MMEGHMCVSRTSCGGGGLSTAPLRIAPHQPHDRGAKRDDPLHHENPKEGEEHKDEPHIANLPPTSCEEEEGEEEGEGGVDAAIDRHHHLRYVREYATAQIIASGLGRSWYLGCGMWRVGSRGAVVRAVAALRRQRRRALQDIARLALLRERALASPVAFVLGLKRALPETPRSEGPEPKRLATSSAHGNDKEAEAGCHTDALPRRQQVVRLPHINFREYARVSFRRVEPWAKRQTENKLPGVVSVSGVALAGECRDEVLVGSSVRPSSRVPCPEPGSQGMGASRPALLQSCGQNNSAEESSAQMAGFKSIKKEPVDVCSDEIVQDYSFIKQEHDIKKELHLPLNQGEESNVIMIEDPKPGDVVRGRVWDDDKPSSFNKLWNSEEQRRLEQLLLEIPEEEVAAHRWAKIARALGNRTPRQVASRVQKYFIKLARAGLPVPGKPPNLDVCLRKRRKAQSASTSGGNRMTEEGSYYTLPPVPMPDEGEYVSDEKEDAPAYGDEVQPHYDDEDYQTYRSRSPSYLDPTFMPS